MVVVVQTSFVVVEPSAFRRMDLKETGPSWRLESGGTNTSECKEGNLRRLVASGIVMMVQTSFADAGNVLFPNLGNVMFPGRK